MAATGKPIFDSMIEQHLLSKNIFAFYMAMHPGDKSELLFGRYDPEKYVGDINWHPVIDKLFWSVRLDDIKYNGVPLNICKDKPNGCMMTPDSGTSLLTAPGWASKILQDVLPVIEDCAGVYEIGVLTYVIEGIDYELPSNQFMSHATDVMEPGDSICFSNISKLDILQKGQADLFVLGDAFMQMFYTIFDRDNDRVGFARSRIYAEAMSQTNDEKAAPNPFASKV